MASYSDRRLPGFNWPALYTRPILPNALVQVMLRQQDGTGTYVCVSEDRQRFNLGNVSSCNPSWQFPPAVQRLTTFMSLCCAC